MGAIPDDSDWKDVVSLMRMDARQLGRSPEHAARFLLRFISAMNALAAQHRRVLGLNANEMHALSRLWEAGRMTMSELGDRIPLSRAAVTTLIDRLERREMVRRVPGLDDRRQVMVEITHAMEAEFGRVRSDWCDYVTRYVRALDEESWIRVVEVLADLRDDSRSREQALRVPASDRHRDVNEADGVQPDPMWW